MPFPGRCTLTPMTSTRLRDKRPTGLTALLLGLLAVSPARAQVVEYYHTDAIGNVRAITDASGNVIERHDYQPYGEEWLPQGGTQPLRFTGKERDAETGLDYFGARYYGSKIGRFTTVDPVYTWRENLVDPQRWDRYAYARNNPLKYTDPDGRAINLVAGGIGAGIGGVAGFVGSAWAQHAQGGAFVLQNAWAAAAGGAVSGGLAGLTLGTSLAAQGGIGAVVAIGAGTNAVGGAVTRSLDSSEGTRPGDFKEVAIDLGVGAAGGVIGAKATGAWSGSIRQLEATEAGMRESARAGGAGSFGAAHGAAGVAGATAAARTTAEVTGTVVGAKTTNVAAPRIRVELEKKE